MKRIIFIILISIVGIHANIFGYVSPGIRLHFRKKPGLEISFQITYGQIIKSFDKNIPGITVGVVWNKSYHGFFSDFQISQPGLVGLPLYSGGGVGRSVLFYRNRGYLKRKRYYNRLKLWTGNFGLVSYEYWWSFRYDNFHNLGFMGVFPIPLYNDGVI